MSTYVKDLTVTGLLIFAVMFLYRELRNERIARQTVSEQTRVFVEKQSEVMISTAQRHDESARSQVKALEGVNHNLQQLTAATHELVQENKDSVRKIVDVALRDLDKKHS